MKKKGEIFSFTFILFLTLIIGTGCDKGGGNEGKQDQKLFSEKNVPEFSSNDKAEPIQQEAEELEEYVFVKKWDKKTLAIGESFSPTAVATDKKGYIYILEGFYNRILKFNENGQLLLGWAGEKKFLWGYGIVVDSKDYLYLTDPWGNTIYKYNSSGGLIKKWGKPGKGNGEFNEPCGIAVDSKDQIYITDRFNHCIQKFTSDGEFISSWGKLGYSEPGEFHEPMGIAIDSQDFVYVGDTWNDRVQKFDSDGNFITLWGKAGEKNGEFHGTTALATDSRDFVYVLDLANHRIQKFTSDGKYITKWGKKGWKGDGQFDHPKGITIDVRNYVYVGDIGLAKRIQIFREKGGMK